MSSNPALTIRPLTPEDLTHYQALRHLVFKDSINKVLYTREPSEETQARVLSKHIADLQSGVFYIGCWDTSTQTLIAGARWRHVRPKPSPDAPNSTLPRDFTQDELDALFTIPPPYPESDPQVFSSLFGLFNTEKRKNMGAKNYFCLDTLVTHPAHQRRGAGALLVKWGCEQADQWGLEAYLEASPMGAPLYARFGFEEITTVNLGLGERWGGERLDFILMKRPAMGQKAESGGASVGA